MCCSGNASVKPVEILHLSFLTVYICFAYTLHHQDLSISFSFFNVCCTHQLFHFGHQFPTHLSHPHWPQETFEPRYRRAAWIKLSYQCVWAKAGGGMKWGVQRNDKFIDGLSDLQIPNNAKLINGSWHLKAEQGRLVALAKRSAAVMKSINDIPLTAKWRWWITV